MQPSTPELDAIIAQVEEIRTTLQGITATHPLYYPLTLELDTLELQVIMLKRKLEKSPD